MVEGLRQGVPVLLAAVDPTLAAPALIREVQQSHKAQARTAAACLAAAYLVPSHHLPAAVQAATIARAVVQIQALALWEASTMEAPA